jgi:hypothetical protein
MKIEKFHSGIEKLGMRIESTQAISTDLGQMSHLISSSCSESAAASGRSQYLLE